MKVTVFSTKGKKKFDIETEATTWGELREQLVSEGVEVDGMRAIIGETKVSLESSKALLPTNDNFHFTLFLSPVKVKSGASINVTDMNYKACRGFIKDAIASDEKTARAHFGNYTNKSTPQLRDMISSWITKNGTVTDAEEGTVESSEVVGLIDETINMLNLLRDKVSNMKSEVVDNSVELEKVELERLSAQFKEIEKTL